MKLPPWIILAGMIMMLSGMLHLLLWTITGESWEGPLSIRKPILFGISTGLTLISLGWIQQKLRSASYDVLVNRLFAAAMLIEVGLISMQYWRGTASHFNHATVFNATVDRTITCLILFAAIVIVDVTRRSFTFLDATPDMQLAIRSGMGFLVISCGLGFFILFYGEYLASLNKPPEIFGKSGVMKFPHGVAIHAVQFLPLLVWGMTKSGIDCLQRKRLLMLAIAAMAAWLVFSMLQTFSGRARYDLGLAGAVTLSVAVLLILPVARALAVASLNRFRRKPTASWGPP